MPCIDNHVLSTEDSMLCIDNHVLLKTACCVLMTCYLLKTVDAVYIMCYLLKTALMPCIDNHVLKTACCVLISTCYTKDSRPMLCRPIDKHVLSTEDGMPCIDNHGISGGGGSSKHFVRGCSK